MVQGLRDTESVDVLVKPVSLELLDLVKYFGFVAIARDTISECCKGRTVSGKLSNYVVCSWKKEGWSEI